MGSVGRVTLYGELGVWIAGYACGLAFEFAESTIMKYAYKWKLTPDPVRRAPLTNSRALIPHLWTYCVLNSL